MKGALVIFGCLCALVLSSQNAGGCENDPSLIHEDTVSAKVRRLALNSAAGDFSPFFHQGQLYFVSGRVISGAVEYRDAGNSTEISNLFSARMRDSVRSSKANLLPAPVNSRYHEGPLCLSADGNTIYYSSNTKRSAKPKLFSALRSAEKWQSPAQLSFCLDSFSYVHPSISQRGDTLWFSSDLRGSYGAMDIYYSVKGGNGWSDPVNAGSTVNSAYNEVFPFIGRNGQLYFASNRAGGAGGMDLYRISASNGNAQAQLLPAPFNSVADDFGIWLDSTGRKGYLSSNRNPKTGDDIFYFSDPLPDFSGAIQLKPRKRFCYTFFDTITQRLNDTTGFEFEWDFGDGQKARGIRTRHCFEKPGAYQINLNIVQRVSGEVFNTSTTHDLEIPYPPAIRIVSADTVAADSCFRMKFVAEGLESYLLGNSYWLFGDGRYNTGAEIAHRYRKPGEYDLQLFVEAMDVLENKKVFFKAEKKIIISN